MSATHEFEEKDTLTILTEIVTAITTKNQDKFDVDVMHRTFDSEVKKSGLQRSANFELFDLMLRMVCGKPQPKPSLVATDPTEKEARRLELMAKRLRREKEAVALVEKRFALRIAADCTMHELWKMGGAAQKLGKRGDKRLVKNVLSEAQLEKAGIGTV